MPKIQMLFQHHETYLCLKTFQFFFIAESNNEIEINHQLIQEEENKVTKLYNQLSLYSLSKKNKKNELF